MFNLWKNANYLQLEHQVKPEHVELVRELFVNVLDKSQQQFASEFSVNNQFVHVGLRVVIAVTVSFAADSEVFNQNRGQ